MRNQLANQTARYKSNTYCIRAIETEPANQNIKPSSHLHQTLVWGSSLCTSSDDVCHFKRDNNLKLTRWTWLQADRAHICAGIVEVAACETPTTLSNRRIECPSPGEATVGRTCSLFDRRIAKVIWDPLCQAFSNAYTGEGDQNPRNCVEVQSALRGKVR